MQKMVDVEPRSDRHEPHIILSDMSLPSIPLLSDGESERERAQPRHTYEGTLLLMTAKACEGRYIITSVPMGAPRAPPPSTLISNFVLWIVHTTENLKPTKQAENMKLGLFTYAYCLVVL